MRCRWLVHRTHTILSRAAQMVRSARGSWTCLRSPRYPFFVFVLGERQVTSTGQETLELIHAGHNKTGEVAVTTLDFPDNETTTFWVGTEEGNVYQANRYDRAGAKAGLNQYDIYKGHAGPVMGLHFHPLVGPVDFSDLFLTASVDWTVKLWRAKSLAKPSTAAHAIAPIYSFDEADDYVYDVKWHPTQPALFGTVDGSGKFDLWNLNTDTEVRRGLTFCDGGAEWMCRCLWYLRALCLDGRSTGWSGIGRTDDGWRWGGATGSCTCMILGTWRWRESRSGRTCKRRLRDWRERGKRTGQLMGMGHGLLLDVSSVAEGRFDVALLRLQLKAISCLPSSSSPFHLDFVPSPFVIFTEQSCHTLSRNPTSTFSRSSSLPRTHSFVKAVTVSPSPSDPAQFPIQTPASPARSNSPMRSVLCSTLHAVPHPAPPGPLCKCPSRHVPHVPRFLLRLRRLHPHDQVRSFYGIRAHARSCLDDPGPYCIPLMVNLS